MSQWQVKYSDEKSLDAVASQIVGLWDTATSRIIVQGLGPDGGGFVVSPPVLKTPGDGYIYRAVQWNDDDDKIPLPAGATMTVDPATGVKTITVTPSGGTQVVLTSPIPAGCPICF